MRPEEGVWPQSQPGPRELQIEIEHLRSLAGQSLLAQVNSVTVGSMKVSGKGIAQLTRNTERGQATPMVAHGSVVTVKTKAGIVLAFGRPTSVCAEGGFRMSPVMGGVRR